MNDENAHPGKGEWHKEYIRLNDALTKLQDVLYSQPTPPWDEFSAWEWDDIMSQLTNLVDHLLFATPVGEYRKAQDLLAEAEEEADEEDETD